MTQITSQNNPKLKQLRKLARARERARTGLFVAEGEDLVAAAAVAGVRAVHGYRAAGHGGAPGGHGAGTGADRDDAGACALDCLLDFEQVDPELLASVSTLGSGTRAIGVYEQRFADAPAGPLCLYLHGVGDPGNVGAVLRSALAFGADSVTLGPGCADPHSAKAVRASMGAIFSVPLARAGGAGELPGVRVALVAHAGQALVSLAAALPAGEPLTLLVGAEREGLPKEVVAACDSVAHIPIAGESLNAAMAATVALYELTRESSRVPAR
jgi:RNA methyltransferase, TrmH family